MGKDRTITAEGAFSVTYRSTNLGNVATGFNLTVSGPENVISSIRGKKTITVSNGDTSATFGTPKGIVLLDGKRESRTYKGSSVVIVDPVYKLFQKYVIFTTAKCVFSDTASSVGNLVVVDARKRILLFNMLRAGNIQAFFEGIAQPTEVIIKYDKVKKSPVIKALKGAADLTYATAMYAKSIMEEGEMISVGEIFNRFIVPLGLELYWKEDNIWELEPPRLSEGSPTPVPPSPIRKEDIVDLQMNSDPYNAPDIVIPSMVRNSSVGKMASIADFAGKTLAAGILGQKGKGSDNFKVTTFDLPYFLTPEIKTAVTATKEFGYDKYEGGINPQSNILVAADIARFFGAHARKSALYSQVTGYCVMVFSPHVNKPYSWYVIDDKLCFVSDIVHNITRSSASTVLTIAGVYTPDYDTSDKIGNSPSKMPDMEKDFNTDMISKAENKSKEIKAKVQKGAKPKKLKKGKEPEEDMKYIFGDWEDHQSAVQGKLVEIISDFTPPDKEQ